MRRRISIRGCVRPYVRPSVRPWVRGSVSIKEKRGLGASYVGYPTLFFSGREKRKSILKMAYMNQCCNFFEEASIFNGQFVTIQN